MKRILSVFLSLVVLNGCATIFTGTKDAIHINSNPEGASVSVNGISYGKTPATVDVQRSVSETKTVTLKKEGFHETSFALNKSFNTISILNIFVGLWPWAIDIVTGAVMKYDPVNYSPDLEKKH